MFIGEVPRGDGPAENSVVMSASVSLPMYDLPFPELRSAHARFLSALASALRIRGEEAAAVRVEAAARREDESIAAASNDQHTTATMLWDGPTLLLTQMCGLALHDKARASQPSEPLVRLATPCYSAVGCSSGTYRAWICVRAADANDGTYLSLADLAGGRVAVNHLDSFSGCVALRAAVAQHVDASRVGSPILFFDPSVVVTGSHRASMAAVLAGKADCASIDCITWAHIERHHPDEVKDLCVIGEPRCDSTDLPIQSTWCDTWWRS